MSVTPSVREGRIATLAQLCTRTHKHAYTLRPSQIHTFSPPRRGLCVSINSSTGTDRPLRTPVEPVQQTSPFQPLQGKRCCHSPTVTVIDQIQSRYMLQVLAGFGHSPLCRILRGADGTITLTH